MITPERADQLEQFDRFVKGEVFSTVPPVKLDVFNAADVQVIKACDLRVGYGSRDTRDARYIGNQEVLNAIARATRLFSRYCTRPIMTTPTNNLTTEIEIRYGMFAEGMPRSVDVSGFHLDTQEGINREFEPISTISAVIGAPTMAFYGRARRISDLGDVELVEGEVDHLDNGLYLLPPTAVHAEATLPIVPEARIFWRKFQ